MMLAACIGAALVSLAWTAPANPCVCPSNPEYSINTQTVITSPGFGTNQLCNSIACKYRIFANNGQHVKISINAFYTFGSLTIYNGPKGDDPDMILAVLNGIQDTSTLPSLYSSVPRDGSGGVITMVYKASAGDAKAKAKLSAAEVLAAPSFGFNLTFASTTDKGCGTSQLTQQLNGNNVTIRTPNYPFNYPPDLFCNWNFTAPAGQLAKIAFGSDAKTEPQYDNVVISKGDGSQAVSYSGTYGQGGPPPAFAPVQGSQRSLQVTFSSDDEVIYSGFQAVLFGYTPPTQCDCGQTIHYIQDLTKCLTITSPNYGPGHSGYCENAHCVYNLVVQDNAYRARISFTSFDLETGYDHLDIYDGINGFQLESCTGSTCAPRTSADNKLTLKFTTDSSIGKAGYSAQFCAALPS